MDEPGLPSLILVDPNKAMCQAWSRAFEGLPDIRIVQGRFEHLDRFDCMVSPANSFGLMDGGVDAAITRFFGDALPRRVQQRILEEFLGEQPVGTSLIVETGHLDHPFLAHTPTMRVPMLVSRTDYVYLAMHAILVAVRAHNQHEDRRIEVVACPGLGTGVGQMPFTEAARQMALAYRNALKPPARLNWQHAHDRQAAIRRGGDYWLREASDKPTE